MRPALIVGMIFACSSAPVSTAPDASSDAALTQCISAIQQLRDWNEKCTEGYSECADTLHECSDRLRSCHARTQAMR